MPDPPRCVGAVFGPEHGGNFSRVQRRDAACCVRPRIVDRGVGGHVADTPIGLISRRRKLIEKLFVLLGRKNILLDSFRGSTAPSEDGRTLRCVSIDPEAIRRIPETCSNGLACARVLIKRFLSELRVVRGFCEFGEAAGCGHPACGETEVLRGPVLFVATLLADRNVRQPIQPDQREAITICRIDGRPVRRSEIHVTA